MNRPWLGRTIDERFWSKVEKTESCWNWTGADNGLGYGEFWIAGLGKTYAHRTSYRLSGRAITDGMKVLHKCDNPRCVNPDHLFLGTMEDNTKDAMRKGRLSSGPSHSEKIVDRLYGERNPHSKLNLRAVAEIRDLACVGWTHNRIASEYGVSRRAITKVVNRETWA